MKTFAFKAFLTFFILLFAGSCEKDGILEREPAPGLDQAVAMRQLLYIVPPGWDCDVVFVGCQATTVFSAESAEPVEIVEIVEARIDGDNEFYITNNITPPLPAVLVPGECIEMEVVFAPESEGIFNGQLVIVTGGGLEFRADLTGEGIYDLPPVNMTIADLIVFFDENVDAGNIDGACPQLNSACDAKLEVFRELLWRANYLYEHGKQHSACNTLARAYARSDGQELPPDFIEGSVVAELNGMIAEVMDNLGCE